MVEMHGEYRKGIIYCTQCGNQNIMENQFCDSCGVNLDEYNFREFSIEQPSVRILSIHEPQSASTFQQNHSLNFPPVQHHPQNRQKATPKGIIGLVIGMFSILVMLFMSTIPFINIYLAIFCSTLTILGIILSSLAVNEDNLGTIGLILNMIGFTMYAVFLFLYAALFYF